MKEAVVGTRGGDQAESTAPACMGVTGFDRGSIPRTSTSLDFRFGDIIPIAESNAANERVPAD